MNENLIFALQIISGLGLAWGIIKFAMAAYVFWRFEISNESARLQGIIRAHGGKIKAYGFQVALIWIVTNLLIAAAVF